MLRFYITRIYVSALETWRLCYHLYQLYLLNFCIWLNICLFHNLFPFLPFYLFTIHDNNALISTIHLLTSKIVYRCFNIQFSIFN